MATFTTATTIRRISSSQHLLKRSRASLSGWRAMTSEALPWVRNNAPEDSIALLSLQTVVSEKSAAFRDDHARGIADGIHRYGRTFLPSPSCIRRVVAVARPRL